MFIPIIKTEALHEKERVIDYERCILYFGIREQKQILIIENRFIAFENIPP